MPNVIRLLAAALLVEPKAALVIIYGAAQAQAANRPVSCRNVLRLMEFVPAVMLCFKMSLHVFRHDIMPPCLVATIINHDARERVYCHYIPLALIEWDSQSLADPIEVIQACVMDHDLSLPLAS